MKVSDYRASQIAQSYGLPKLAEGTGKARKAEQRADAASLSATAQELLKTRRAAQEAPEVRADLVAELRRQVQDGTYQVNEHALARRLLQHAGELDT